MGNAHGQSAEGVHRTLKGSHPSRQTPDPHCGALFLRSHGVEYERRHIWRLRSVRPFQGRGGVVGSQFPGALPPGTLSAPLQGASRSSRKCSPESATQGLRGEMGMDDERLFSLDDCGPPPEGEGGEPVRPPAANGPEPSEEAQGKLREPGEGSQSSSLRSHRVA